MGSLTRLPSWSSGDQLDIENICQRIPSVSKGFATSEIHKRIEKIFVVYH